MADYKCIPVHSICFSLRCLAVSKNIFSKGLLWQYNRILAVIDYFLFKALKILTYTRRMPVES